LLVFKDAERELDQLPHGGAQSDHFGLATGQEALIQGANVGVMAGGDDGSHIQSRAAPGCPGFGEPGPAAEAAAGLAFNGDQTQESRGLIGGLEFPAAQDRQ
jgi:hypothetical protein